MFDLVTKHKRLLQVILGLMILPFAFFGIDSYTSSARNAGEAASVDGTPVSGRELADETRRQFDRLRQMLGAGADPAALDTPEMRLAILESLISQRLITNEVEQGAPRAFQGRRWSPASSRRPNSRKTASSPPSAMPAISGWSGCRTRATWPSCAWRSRRRGLPAPSRAAPSSRARSSSGWPPSRRRNAKWPRRSSRRRRILGPRQAGRGR